MHFDSPTFLLAGVLFVGIIFVYVFGVRLRQYRIKAFLTTESNVWGPFEGALLGLLALLLAFTFNQSASHYDSRRDILIAERNGLAAVLLRTDLYPEPVRTQLRDDLRDFMRIRVEYFDAGLNEELIRAALQEGDVVSTRMWARVARSAGEPSGILRSTQMLPAITVMIENVYKREETRRRQVPEPVLWVLFLLTLAGSFILGYAGVAGKIDWVILCTYALMAVMTIYLILDLDHPRRGFIDVNAAHDEIRNLLQALVGPPSGS